MNPTAQHSSHSPMALVLILLSTSAACGSDGDADEGWGGTIEVTPSGQTLVHNPDRPLWGEGEEWQITEELRIGRLDGDGPDVFGSVTSFDVDPLGRVWVFDGQAQELRVFGPDGAHVRTVGRRGGGPGEFAQAVHVQIGPDGLLWVMDPQNNRVSLFDTTGAYTGSHSARGGFIILPWPGRFDREGNYYAPIPRTDGGEFRMELLRHDSEFQPLDTVSVPRDPVERETLDLRTEGGGIRASIPYQGSLSWRLAPGGTLWGLVTDQYRLFETNRMGDTLRSIRRDFTRLPVTAADRERAVDQMEWFTRQGGRFDPSVLPSSKPPVTGYFFIDNEEHLWVEVTTEPEDQGRRFDIFDPEGRYLGSLRLPFSVSRGPVPVFRGDHVYILSRDELEVTYLVRARLDRRR